MIHFLFGRPGSGKTHAVVEQINALAADGSRPIYLIVPEQQAYSAERDVLSALPASAGSCFTILSFSRLCDVLAESYGGRSHASVSRAMRSLLMWENLRELTGTLETYAHGGSTDPSLCKKMLSTAEELKVNAISPTSLERAAEHLPMTAPLRGKLRDLALVTAAYEGLIGEVYGENPSDRLLRAAEQLEKHGFFRHAVVFIDSFTSFTAQEYAILRHVVAQADEVTVTFGCDGREDPQPQFASMKDAIRRLTRLCEDVGVPTEDHFLTGSHRTVSPELLALEASLWDFGLSREGIPSIQETDRGSVRAVVCPTLYDEAQAAVLHILEQYRSGVPYGEMAVVVRDTSVWDGVLDAALEAYGIPYFLSENTDIGEKPAARLLLTALRCISRHYRAEDVVALCKTGLLGLSLRQIDYFAEYVDTWKLSGNRMTETVWNMNPDGYTVNLSERGKAILSAANATREAVMTPLLELEATLRGAETVTEQCAGLYQYLCAHKLRETLSEQAKEFLALGQVREAGEQVRLWSFLTETLATVATVMKDAEPLTAEELCTALSLVFADTDIGSVPARHECVTVGSAATLRVDNIRVMLVLGLCEGEFPQAPKDDGLLSQQDKETLHDLGIDLPDRAERLTSDELLYVWRSFSKPSETLILSYSKSTTDGQTRSPSAAFNRVRYLLPHVQPVSFSSDMLSEESGDRYRPPVSDTVPRPTVRKLLGEEIWLSQSRLETYFRCPYSYYGSHILRLRERAEATFDNLNAGNFIHHVMEQYLKRALDEDNRLRPMEASEATETADAIILAYMEQLCGDLRENGRLLHLFDRLRQIALMLIQNIQEELSGSAFTVAGLEWDTHGRKAGDPKPWSMMLDPTPPSPLPIPHGNEGIVLPSVNRDAPSTPSLLPISGNGAESYLPPTTDIGSLASAVASKEEIREDPVKLLMGGRIDRVDLYRAEDGETVYVRVIDYKSSQHDFSLQSVTRSMNIQLMLYLFTLCSPENRSLFVDRNGTLPTRVLPASAIYVSPDESDREGTLLPCRTGVVLEDKEVISAFHQNDPLPYLPSVKRNKAGELTGKGLYSVQDMENLEKALHQAIRDTVSAMYAGTADRTPSADACRFCLVKDSCAVCAQS